MRQIISSRSYSSPIRSYKPSVGKKAEPENMQSVDRRRTLKMPKRIRSAFTTDQVNCLEQAYKRYPYIDREGRQHLASVLKLGERPIKIWFQNRRMKEKKESNNHKESDVEIQVNDMPLGQQQLNNVPASSSTNDNSPHSLPILSPSADSTVKTNSVEINKFDYINEPPTPTVRQNVTNNAAQKKSPQRANFYKETTNFEGELITSPYFSKQTKADSTVPSTSAAKRKLPFQENDSIQFADVSINLCKKYKEERVSPETAVTGNIANEGQKKIPEQEAPKPSKIDHNIIKKNVLPNLGTNAGISGLLPKPAKPNVSNVNEPVFFPVMPGVYPSPFVSPDGVVWKPVNFMPMMATNGPPMNTGSQGPPMPLSNQVTPILEGSRNCTCNCHSNPHVPLTFPPSFQNPYTQYVISVPFPHTSPNF